MLPMESFGIPRVHLSKGWATQVETITWGSLEGYLEFGGEILQSKSHFVYRGVSNLVGPSQSPASYLLVLLSSLSAHSLIFTVAPSPSLKPTASFCFQGFSQAVLPAVHRSHSLTSFKSLFK